MISGRPASASGHNVDPRSLAIELNHTLDEGKQRVITATGDIPARVEMRTTLTHDDAAGADRLAAEYLEAQTLSV
jgi:hypothetical protein